MKEETTKSNEVKQNIPDDMFNRWKRLQGHGDVGEIAKFTNYSRPVITAAIKYGCVKKEELRKKIEEFYNQREGVTDTATAPETVEGGTGIEQALASLKTAKKEIDKALGNLTK